MIWLPIALAVFLTACEHKSEQKPTIVTGDVIPVKIMELTQTEQGRAIAASGQLSTDDEVILSFKTGGVISEINVKEGDFVRKGQLLAKLNLTEIRTGVTQTQAALEKATRDFERISNLYKDSVATLEQLQNTKTAMDIARQQNEAAQYNLNFSEIRAVENGYILKKFANPGQIVTPGQAIIQANGAGRNHWILKAGVSDQDWATISNNDKAQIKLDAIGGGEVAAKVVRKSQGIDPGNGAFTVELEITTPNSALASGMFGEATINTQKTATVWNVPYNALLEGNEGKGYVFVTNDGKTATKVPVRIIAINKDSASVTDGLSGFKSLIVSGSAYLTDKASIKVLNN